MKVRLIYGDGISTLQLNPESELEKVTIKMINERAAKGGVIKIASREDDISLSLEIMA